MSETPTPSEIIALQLKANTIRQLVIEALLAAGSGHTAGSLGMADILAALYFHVLRHDPHHPYWEDRDRLVLSNGHICPALYAAMALAGYFPLEELKTLRRINSRLQGHPYRPVLPGLETTSGSLGEGLGQAVGIALGGRLSRQDFTVYCLTSDAEHQEGGTWEAVMTAAKYKLEHLVCFVDRNFIQCDGGTEEIMPLESLAKKYAAFNWFVQKIDGNDIQAFLAAVDAAQAAPAPAVILAYTVPGKGVSFMENDYRWHGKSPDAAEAARALEELRAARGPSSPHDF